MPMGNDEKSKVLISSTYTQGFAFIEFENAEMAATAIEVGNGHKLDKSHVLSMTKFDDVPIFANMNDCYVDPEIEPFEEKEHLRSWLSDPLARDQWAMLRGDEVGIYWNNKSEAPDEAQVRQVINDLR